MDRKPPYPPAKLIFDNDITISSGGNTDWSPGWWGAEFINSESDLRDGADSSESDEGETEVEIDLFKSEGGCRLMNVQVKSSNGITVVPIESRLMASRSIFIEGGIDADTACDFVKKVMLLNSEDSKQTIDVLISSGMLMYDVIQAGNAPILEGFYSMEAVLLACGDHGRNMLPHCKLMMHEPLLGDRVGGNSSSIKSISDNLPETKNR